VLARDGCVGRGHRRAQARAAAAAEDAAGSTPSASPPSSRPPTTSARARRFKFSDELSRDADLARLLQDIPKAEDLLGSTSDAPVIRMINALLLQSLRERASDIHFEPYELRSVVRFRVDGVLRDIIEPPRALHAALVSRLKVMASLDIAKNAFRRTDGSH
jgi:type II secretory ATPase GspE/PulE/Tfp pilus assembly ATPase PilB-like protein